MKQQIEKLGQVTLSRKAQQQILGGAIIIGYIWTCNNTCVAYTSSTQCKANCKNGGTCIRTFAWEPIC